MPRLAITEGRPPAKGSSSGQAYDWYRPHDRRSFLPFPIFTRGRMLRGIVRMETANSILFDGCPPSQPRRFVQNLYLKELRPCPAFSPVPQRFDFKTHPLLWPPTTVLVS